METNEPKRRGRKPVGGPHDYVMMVRLDQETGARLERLCEDLGGVAPAAYVRRCVERNLPIDEARAEVYLRVMEERDAAAEEELPAGSKIRKTKQILGSPKGADDAGNKS